MAKAKKKAAKSKVRRFTDAPSLNRPRKDYVDFVDFVDLDGGYGTFDITESVGVNESGDENVWYGRDVAHREHEILYRTPEGRWVLVFVIPPGHENDEGLEPLDRELTPVQAARWFRLNELPLPTGVRPASLHDEAERRIGQARLDRDWMPPRRPDEAPTERVETARVQPVSLPTEQSLPKPLVPEPEPSGPEPNEPEHEPPAPPHSPPVVLNGPDGEPIVLGKRKKALTRAKYDVVKTLLEAERPMSNSELSRKSRRTDARKHLNDLAKSDADWKAVIIFPAVYGAGYDIRR